MMPSSADNSQNGTKKKPTAWADLSREIKTMIISKAVFPYGNSASCDVDLAFFEVDRQSRLLALGYLRTLSFIRVRFKDYAGLPEGIAQIYRTHDLTSILRSRSMDAIIGSGMVPAITTFEIRATMAYIPNKPYSQIILVRNSLTAIWLQLVVREYSNTDCMIVSSSPMLGPRSVHEAYHVIRAALMMDMSSDFLGLYLPREFHDTSLYRCFGIAAMQRKYRLPKSHWTLDPRRNDVMTMRYRLQLRYFYSARNYGATSNNLIRLAHHAFYYLAKNHLYHLGAWHSVGQIYCGIYLTWLREHFQKMPELRLPTILFSRRTHAHPLMSACTYHCELVRYGVHVMPARALNKTVAITLQMLRAAVTFHLSVARLLCIVGMEAPYLHVDWVTPMARQSSGYFNRYDRAIDHVNRAIVTIRSISSFINRVRHSIEFLQWDEQRLWVDVRGNAIWCTDSLELAAKLLKAIPESKTCEEAAEVIRSGTSLKHVHQVTFIDFLPEHPDAQY